MDNFRKPKRSQPRSVDGFIRHTPTGRLSSNLDFKRPQSYRPTQTTEQSLDNFKRPDGFHASSVATAPPAVLQQPRHHQPLKETGRFAHLGKAEEKAKPKKKRTKKKIILRSLLVFLCLGVLTGGFLFAKGYLKIRHVFKGGAPGAVALQENVDPNMLKGEGDGRVNILIMGKGGPGHDGPDLTDTMLIASIDPINKEAALLSVPRDLYVKVPGFGSMKINAAYATAKYKVQNGKKIPDQAAKAEQAGLDNVQKVIADTLGIPIHYYVMIDFQAFSEAIDTVGGVSVDVQQQLYDPTMAWENNNNPLLAAKGLQQFNGKKALLYVRSRHGSARGDFDRTERQRQVILALKDKVLSLGTYSNPLKISQLLDAFGNHIQTNLSINDSMRLYNIGKAVGNDKVQSIGLADPPNNFVTTAAYDGQSVVVPRAGIYNYTEIQNYVRNTLKDGYIKKENPAILVLNGTYVSGLAVKKANELKTYGYNVLPPADAPTKNYNQTILVDLRGGEKKYTRRYLEQRYKVTAVGSLPDASIVPGSADFVIILGANETNN